MNILTRYYNLKWLQLFSIILVANLLMIWLSKTVLINETVFYNTFSEQLSYDRSLKLFESIRRLSWVGYVFTPFLLLLKFSAISLVIYTGIILSNNQERVTLGSVFKVVIASEIVFLLAGFLKLLWFYLFAGNYNLTDLGFFYPLSLINFFKTGEVSKLWVFPLQAVNAFNIIYIFSVSYGLSRVTDLEKANSDKVVLMTYIPALTLWIALIMFFSIDSSL